MATGCTWSRSSRVCSRSECAACSSATRSATSISATRSFPSSGRTDTRANRQLPFSRSREGSASPRLPHSSLPAMPPPSGCWTSSVSRPRERRRSSRRPRRCSSTVCNSGHSQENPMAELKAGKIVEWHRLSPSLSLFRLVSRDGGARFPSYEAGQYIALRRDDCLLTKKVKDGNEVRYVPDVDADGKQKRGSVTHSYSISSAPFETTAGNYLEFYVVLERDREGVLGRFTESLFRGVETHTNERLAYLERIVGDFTLAKRAAGFEHVLMVGTGTGLAPFVSMVKQLHHEARNGNRPAARYTLLHANRTLEELAYHHELLDIEKSNSFDLVYVPSVSRPTARDLADPQLGTGRANNLLRHVVDLPTKDLGATPPALPRSRPIELLRAGIEPARRVVLAGGIPDEMGDIAGIAGR